MKSKVKCVKCDCFLREKTRRNNDFENRLLCYNCFKETGWNYDMIKTLYPEKVKEFFDNKTHSSSSVVVNFGKYKGMEFKDVIKIDEKYCKWIYEKSLNTDFSNNAFIKYLSNII